MENIHIISTKEDKEVIRKAGKYLGLKVSVFARMAALEKAKQILEDIN